MLVKLKKSILKLLYKFRVDNETYLNHLVAGGAEIGERVRIFYPQSTFIDDTRPFMLHIGDDVQITDGVKILTHDYAWSVLKKKYGPILGSCGKVSIGNNCFIGMNTVILKNTVIGDDCVVGANSLVRGVFGSGLVIAGNPAKPIMTIDDYYKKRTGKQLDEAFELFCCYHRRFGKIPDEDLLSEFFFLFGNPETITPAQKSKMVLTNNFQESLRFLEQVERPFENYSEFVSYCLRRIESEQRR